MKIWAWLVAGWLFASCLFVGAFLLHPLIGLALYAGAIAYEAHEFMHAGELPPDEDF